MDHREGLLNNVFDPNPYRQRGGWFLGFMHNMHLDVELNDDFPRTITQGRIDLMAGKGGEQEAWQAPACHAFLWSAVRRAGKIASG